MSASSSSSSSCRLNDPKILHSVFPYLIHRDYYSLHRINHSLHSTLRSIESSLRSPLSSSSSPDSILSAPLHLWLSHASRPSFLIALYSQHAAPLISSLSLPFAASLSDAHLLPLRHLKRLTALNLDVCQKLTDGAIKILSLSLSSSLLSLSLYWNLQYTDIGCHHIASSPFAASLKYLNLSGCKGIGDGGIIAIAKSCHSLEKLDLTRLVKLTDQSLKAIGESKMARNRSLKSFIVYAIATFTDDGWKAFASGCSSLTHLDMTGSPLISDAAIESIAFSNKGMNRLILQWAIHLTDRSLMAISSSMHQLCWLNVHGLTKITDDGLLRVAKNCRLIDTLDINGCSGLTRKTLEEWQKEFRKLNQLLSL